MTYLCFCLSGLNSKLTVYVFASFLRSKLICLMCFRMIGLGSQRTGLCFCMSGLGSKLDDWIMCLPEWVMFYVCHAVNL